MDDQNRSAWGYARRRPAPPDSQGLPRSVRFGYAQGEPFCRFGLDLKPPSQTELFKTNPTNRTRHGALKALLTLTGCLRADQLRRRTARVGRKRPHWSVRSRSHDGRTRSDVSRPDHLDRNGFRRRPKASRHLSDDRARASRRVRGRPTRVDGSRTGPASTPRHARPSRHPSVRTRSDPPAGGWRRSHRRPRPAPAF